MEKHSTKVCVAKKVFCNNAFLNASVRKLLLNMELPLPEAATGGVL